MPVWCRTELGSAARAGSSKAARVGGGLLGCTSWAQVVAAPKVDLCQGAVKPVQEMQDCSVVPEAPAHVMAVDVDAVDPDGIVCDAGKEAIHPLDDPEELPAAVEGPEVLECTTAGPKCAAAAGQIMEQDVEEQEEQPAGEQVQCVGLFYIWNSINYLSLEFRLQCPINVW